MMNVNGFPFPLLYTLGLTQLDVVIKIVANKRCVGKI